MAAVAFRRTGARCAGSFSKSSLDLGGSSSSTFRKAVQDMPPSGGYPQVIHKYTPTIRGPSGAVIWGVSTVLIMFGFYRVGQTNIARRQEKQATREARFAIAPFLQAEEDLRYVVARRNGEIPPNVYKSPGIWFPPSK